MSAENAGPPHAAGCLGAVRVSESPTGHGHCACERAAWLDERVPRAQARAEVLGQLATWAGEQGVFAEDEVSKPEQDSEAPRASWRQAALRMGGRLAREVYIGVRMTALALAKECNRRPAPVPPPTPTAAAAPELVAGIDAALSSGEVLALLHPDFGEAAVGALRAALVAQLGEAPAVRRAVPHWESFVANGVTPLALVGDRL